MPAPYGITATGLSVPTFEELRDDWYARIRDKFGSTPSDSTIEGQVIAIFAERLAEAYEALEQVYESEDPDAASGILLKNATMLVGTFAQPARKSTDTLTLTGDDGTVVLSGSRAKNPDTGDLFATLENGTLAELTAWVASTVYALGARRKNTGRSYVVTTPGTSAGSGGPTTTSEAITDGSVVWRYLGEGTAVADVPSECTVTGPTVALSGSISEIDTPVSGWESVVNLLDAEVGANADADADLRLRYQADLARQGSTPIDALRSELLELTGVVSVSIFQNNTSEEIAIIDEGPDVFLPPNSVEALVLGGDDQAILEVLHRGIAGGARSFGFPAGRVSGTVIDSEGNELEYEFARPVEQLIYVDVSLEYDASEYPSDGDAQVEAAIVAWGDARGAGRDADASAILAQVFKIDGVLRGSVTVDLTPSPASSGVAIGRHAIAVYDSSRINVTSVAGEP